MAIISIRLALSGTKCLRHMLEAMPTRMSCRCINARALPPATNTPTAPAAPPSADSNRHCRQWAPIRDARNFVHGSFLQEPSTRGRALHEEQRQPMSPGALEAATNNGELEVDLLQPMDFRQRLDDQTCLRCYEVWLPTRILPRGLLRAALGLNIEERIR